MAAAAAFSSSRRTKGLLLIFTLLSLICSTSSLRDKNQLDQLKETLDKVQKQADKLKEDLTIMPKTSALLDDYKNMLDHLMTYGKETNLFDDDILPVGTFLEQAKGFVENTKALLVRITEENENKLKNLKNSVNFLEENRAEL